MNESQQARMNPILALTLFDQESLVTGIGLDIYIFILFFINSVFVVTQKYEWNQIKFWEPKCTLDWFNFSL